MNYTIANDEIVLSPKITSKKVVIKEWGNPRLLYIDYEKNESYFQVSSESNDCHRCSICQSRMELLGWRTGYEFHRVKGHYSLYQKLSGVPKDLSIDSLSRYLGLPLVEGSSATPCFVSVCVTLDKWRTLLEGGKYIYTIKPVTGDGKHTTMISYLDRSNFLHLCSRIETIPENVPKNFLEHRWNSYEKNFSEFKEAVKNCTSSEDEAYIAALNKFKTLLIDYYDSGPQPSKGTHDNFGDDEDW